MNNKRKILTTKEINGILLLRMKGKNAKDTHSRPRRTNGRRR